MRLTRPSQVRTLLEELDLKPSRASGQNFLADANILGIMVETAALSPTDCVLEIGPGLGTVTERLVEAGGRVIAVEKDPRLHTYLQTRLQSVRNLELIGADFLDFTTAELGRMAFNKVVSNLPYSVGSRILMDLFRMAAPPQLIVVTLQLEVMRRLAAAPGSADYGLLSVWAQRVYDVELRKKVSPTCFYPVPAVWSAIGRLERRAVPAEGPRGGAVFYELTKHAFSQRRKQMAVILAHAPGRLKKKGAEGRSALVMAGVDPRARPESLSVEQWLRLADILG